MFRCLAILLLFAAPAWGYEIPPSPVMSVEGLPIVPIWAEFGPWGEPSGFQVVAPEARPTRPEAPAALWEAFDRADWPELWRLALPAAEAGDATALLLAGWAGQRIEAHRDEGRLMLQFAENRGSAFAAYEMGRIYLYGDGTFANPREAIRSFEKAGDLGLVFGYATLTLLAVSYADAPTLAVPDATAAAWARKAGMAGHAVSSRLAGYYQRFGQGVPEDEAGAFLWDLRAANQGLAVCQARVAGEYASGGFVPQDTAEAVRWHVRAAWGYLTQPPGEANGAASEYHYIKELDPDNPALPALDARFREVFPPE